MKPIILFVLVCFSGLCAGSAVSLTSASTQGAYISLATSPSPQTIVAWVSPSATNGVGRSVVTVGGAFQHYNILGLSTAFGKWYCATRAAGSENYVLSTTTPSLNRWVHLAATFGSATSRVIWVNGTAEGTNTTSSTPTLTNIGVGVRADGAFPGSTPSWLDGSLMWVAVYSATLTASEIEQLSGKGNPSRAVSPLRVRPDRLVFFWPTTVPGVPALNFVGGGGTKLIVVTNSPSWTSGPAAFSW